jgi:hypothetical protein
MFQLTSNFLDLFNLPNDIEWYEIDGRKLFEWRNQDGGIISNKLAYLLQRASEENSKRWYKYGISFNVMEQTDRQICIEKINSAINDFQKKLAENPPSNFDADTGTLGLDGF